MDETGFCDICGLQSERVPEARSPDATPGEPAPPRPGRSWLGTGSAEPTSIAGSWSIAGLVTMPILEFPDPSSRIVADPQIPEPSRVCAKTGCGAEVGRTYAGQPALTDGYCPKCGTPFSFSPKLRRGDLVADQYRVVGCIARGGLGWVYLARDVHLDGNYVALKGLINTSDTNALELAVSERRFLTSLHHSNIVRIFNFVTHQDPDSGEQTGYIVMEYLKGLSLREVQKTASQMPGTPLLLEHILAYGHEVLAALEYLHDQGLLYCDMKPENVIRCEDRIKIVDLGGVRRIHDRHAILVGTRGYQVERDEVHKHGLTVRSDLYAVGKTLETLSYASSDRLTERSALTGQGPLGLGVESFRRLIRRATDKKRSRRFASAAEMSEQLKGVLRELLAIRHGREYPERSKMFAPAAALLDADLGAVPSLDCWIRHGTSDSLSYSEPSPQYVAVGLPVPSVPPEDSAATFLTTVSAYDVRSLIDKLETFPSESVEIELRSCRANIELGEFDEAAKRLAAAGNILGEEAADRWRITWYSGLLELAKDDVSAAFRAFDHVYEDLPGETVPKLALGYCAERLGELRRAESYHEAVWLRDRTHASAAFGLARIRLSRGDRAGAIQVLDQVPQVSRHYDAARIAAVRVCFGQLPTGLPSAADFREAVRRLSELHLDGGDEVGESRHRLTAAIREAALSWVRKTKCETLGDLGPILGAPATERSLCVRLEESFRRLANQARNARDYDILVDLANSVRPKTWI